jgi:hypothetical protein
MEEHELLAKATPIVQRVGSNLWQARSRPATAGGLHGEGPAAGGGPRPILARAQPGARAIEPSLNGQSSRH